MAFSSTDGKAGDGDAARVYRWLGAALVLEGCLLAIHFGLTGAEATRVRYVLYPFVWINVGVWAVARARPPAATGRTRLLAAAAGAGYFLALAFVAGLIGFGHGHGGGLGISMAAPGWGPRIGYVSEVFHFQFVPYRVIGYLSLAYLVYATVLEVRAAALGGVVGFGTCLGCTFPLVAPALVGSVGGAAALVPVVATLSVDLSTALFVVSVALLAWRPDAARLSVGHVIE